MSLDRLWMRSAKARLWRWWLDEVVHAPMEPILHPSRYRLLWIGGFTFIGHLVIYVIWGHLVPQPYENLWARLVMAFLALIYVLPRVSRDPSATQSGRLFSLATWIQLPWFFSWMYWMNGGNAAWLGSVAAMILIYYHATDWRLATFGLITGGFAGWASAELLGTDVHAFQEPMANVVVLGFAVIMGIMLGFSGANLRRARLLNTLSTMGVMAHELRTPLATVNLMGDVLRNLVQHDVPESKRKKLDELATRLQNLVRSMNRQIDTQISNAQLMRLPREQSHIMAAALVQDVVSQYPYRSSRERDCVQVHIQSDFCFTASRPLFAQVLTNLIKNALHALAAASTAPSPGDLRLDVGIHHGKGRIAVSDDGIGITHDQQQRIFEPFFSTQAGAGNGLGLTFCKNVVESAQGRLSVHSQPGLGAVFMIDLPLEPQATAEPATAPATPG
ncbi:sensor histidine kinase [Hydrogenophaga sp. BPS33]|uniref:sensor histidine kinase n=1 Tax=Hydrogenophaga sp. BPS33 TaxID=2651974 RepID=UPI001320312C|nr:HAMP domain-containing sensor histidine kinase [Hydrogenophaga sp. BPS33]QHE84357.1 HAMP domain-containing histidine kinase [Hydrogenophaga sp. BPS33]